VKKKAASAAPRINRAPAAGCGGQMRKNPPGSNSYFPRISAAIFSMLEGEGGAETLK
jgi:hypothetical protein